ncbi:MAG TPA: hypothetical protein VLJ17_24445 [Xanthobacteraceae bacterium]|nr:hypothetical protein [Xanthobacteraceae bacterium]
MSLPFIFANATELDTPNLDSNFAAVGAGLTIPCTATGTNAVTLTPLANFPTISAYTNNAPVFGFQAVANTTTSPVTLQVGGLAALNVYKANGAALIGANDFLIGNTYYVVFNQALNSSAGGWVVLNPGSSAATAGAVQSAFKNLVIQNGGTPNTQITLTADSVAVSDGSANFTTLLTVNVTISSATSGANGLDTGSIANSSWYAVYVIYNPTTLTTAGLISLSFTSPTLPSGFTQFSRLGAFRTDGSHNFLRILQKGRRAQYVVTTATNTAALPIIATGTAGTPATPTFVSLATTNFAPTTASCLFLNVQVASAASIIVAANANYGGSGSTTNAPNFNLQAAAANADMTVPSSVVLEAASIQWASTGGVVFIQGWEDNI